MERLRSAPEQTWRLIPGADGFKSHPLHHALVKTRKTTRSNKLKDAAMPLEMGWAVSWFADPSRRKQNAAGERRRFKSDGQD